jgi:hypothetical protein
VRHWIHACNAPVDAPAMGNTTATRAAGKCSNRIDLDRPA